MGTRAGPARCADVWVIVMRGRLRSGRSERSELTCARVRQAISAGLDGEAPGIRARRVAGHVAQCEGCRHFQRLAPMLDRLVGVSASRPVPGSLKDTLTSEWLRALGGVSPGSPRKPRTIDAGHSWHGRLQWVGALCPAVLLVVIVPLGALSGPHEVPSHASTPCTVDLRTILGKIPR